MNMRIIPQLGKISMYKLILLALGVLALIAMVLSMAGLVTPLPQEMLASAAILLATSLAADLGFRRIFRLSGRYESTIIAAGILFFILEPTVNGSGVGGLALAALITVASKYLIVWRGRHLFNPAAVGAFALSGIGVAVPALGASWWWVGNPWMALPVAVAGLAILVRTEKLGMFAVYMLTTMVAGFLRVSIQSGSAGLSAPGLELIWQLITSGPYLFLGLFMLTEPLTLPPRRRQQFAEAALVGAMSGWPLMFGSFSFGQEGALLIGNLFAWVVALIYGRRAGIALTLVGRQRISPTTTEVEFLSTGLRGFFPGQYLELDVPHKSADMRGMRREFSIVSAPSQLPTLRIAYRDQGPLSSYKAELARMNFGQKVRATGVWGDFLLPEDLAKPVLLVAGGIGVAPFISQLQADTRAGVQRDCVLVYAAGHSGEVLYRPEIEKAGVPVFIFADHDPGDLPESWQWAGTEIDQDCIYRIVPDLEERVAYVSGPPRLVNSLSSALSMAKRVHLDAFSGY